MNILNSRVCVHVCFCVCACVLLFVCMGLHHPYTVWMWAEGGGQSVRHQWLGHQGEIDSQDQMLWRPQDMMYLTGYHLQNKNTKMTHFITSKVSRKVFWAQEFVWLHWPGFLKMPLMVAIIMLTGSSAARIKLWNHIPLQVPLSSFQYDTLLKTWFMAVCALDKVSSVQVQWPNFNLWNSRTGKGRKREPTQQRCPLTSTITLWHTHRHTRTQTNTHHHIHT